MLLSLEEGALRGLRRRGIDLEWQDQGGPRPDLLAMATAKWLIDEHALSDLPMVAREEQPHGYRSPIRDAIAACGTDTPLELRDLVGEFMAQLGYADTHAGGVALFCDIYLRRITENLTHPYVGATCLSWAGMHADAAPDDAIRVFTAFAEDWQNQPDSRAEIERAIRHEARRRTIR
jgi:hypothetical protein